MTAHSKPNNARSASNNLNHQSAWPSWFDPRVNMEDNPSVDNVQKVVDFRPSLSDPISIYGPEDHVQYIQQGVQKHHAKRFLLGHYSADIVIDCHGMNQDQAYLQVCQSMDSALANDCRSLHIIHGKGHGVIKNLVIDMIRQHPSVMMYASAPDHLGGKGVLMLYLSNVYKDKT